MEFPVSITDPAKLAGITAAREAYNAALPEEYETVTLKAADPATQDAPEQLAEHERRAITPKPGTLATDAEYVQFVMDRAAESYAKQYGK